MCGCKNKINTTTIVQTDLIVNEDCPFTLEQLTSYKSTLFCVKDNELYAQTNSTETLINSYLGIVTSAIYYPSDLCYFQPSLDEISSFIQNSDLSNCNHV